MKTHEIINHISNLVETVCKGEHNMGGYDTWTYHIVPVTNFAKLLAPKLGADVEVVEIAALLHDYAKLKDPALSKEHHIHGATMAQEILSELNYPQEKIDLVKKSILAHRGSKPVEKNLPEEICLASADAMAHIDQGLYLLVWVCKGRGMSVDQGLAWLAKKIEQSWNKMCPEGREVVREKYESLRILLG